MILKIGLFILLAPLVSYMLFFLLSAALVIVSGNIPR